MICLSYETCNIDGTNRSGPKLLHVSQAYEILKAALEDEECLLVGHYLQFDLAVICAKWEEFIPFVFKAVENDRTTCTKWRMILLDIAAGEYRWQTQEDGTRKAIQYGLADCVNRARLGYYLSKGGDTYRLRYGEFEHVPDLTMWPEAARDYALLDAKATLDVFLWQENMNALARKHHNLECLSSQFHEMRGYWALQLASCWGLRTNAYDVDEFEADVIEEISKVRGELVLASLIRENGTRDMKAVACRMIDACAIEGIPVPKTKQTKCKKTGQMKGGGNVATDEDSCKLVEDPVMRAYARYVKLGALLSKDVKLLRRGAEYPIHASFGAAETMRTTASPNVQNFQREVK